MLASSPGQSYLIAVFVDAIIADTGVSRTQFALAFAVATVISAFTALGLGRTADRIDLRPLWVLVGGCLALGCWLASVADGLALVLVALALLRAGGQGSFPLVGTLLVARNFGGHRGRALGVANSGFTVGAVALPPALAALIVALGWRDTYRLVGLVLLVAVVPLALLIPRRAAAPPGASAHAGTEETAEPASTAGSAPPPPPRGQQVALRVILATPPLVLTAILFHATSVLELSGLSLTAAGATLSVFGAASGLSTILAGILADRLAARRLLTLMCVVLTASALVLVAPGATAAFLGFALLGVGGGVFGVAAGVVWARQYGLRQLGTLQGTAFAAQIVGAALGPLPLAVSHAASGSYVPGLAALAGAGTLSLALALRWREPRTPGLQPAS
jgi:MFS family permease